MEAKAIARYVRVTPRKADQVLQLIRGKRVDQATEILDFTPKHVAKVIGKVVKSAVANAVAMEGRINIEELRVKEAVAGAGPTMKRFLPRAQGRATPILKKTCHITVIVEGEVSEEDAALARRARRVAPRAEARRVAESKPAAKVAEPAASTSKKPTAKKPAAKKAETKKAEPKKAETKGRTAKKPKEAK
jgi:large subunit ribosomal protein L22